MVTFLTVVYVFVCLFLILVVLLQAGKGGGLGALGGGGPGGSPVFGGAGAGNFLTRLTVVSAALFMILSATLAYMSSAGDKALERVSETIEAKEAARAISPTETETPEPAGRSLPDDEQGAAANEEAPVEEPAPEEPRAPTEGTLADPEAQGGDNAR